MTDKAKYPVLSQVNSPQDLKHLSAEGLRLLSKEAREYILNTVAANGGHLAPNLGVVELTIALHLVFDTAKDKVIWDVGHQTYAHKLFTGRRDDFIGLRREGGLSGFPKREESPHDAFNTGHSSTSISLACGMAKARDLAGDKYSVVAVIGDGALTGGMVYEAMNYAGEQKRPLIVVLNDNEMSINGNVGAMANYLVQMRTGPSYGKAKQEVETILKSIPKVGPQVTRVVERLKDSLKYFLVPGMFFEELGFTYLGPIDGHNIGELTGALKRAKKMQEPVVLHVITKKGKGYGPAEANPDKFHGVPSFDLKTGALPPKETTYTSVFGDTLLDLAKDDKSIVALTAAMPDGTGLGSFFAKYPDRAIDVGIAEEHAVTMAAALAVSGCKPVVAIYSSFLQRAYDQLLHDVCLNKLPVLLALDRAGVVTGDGPTHQGIYDLSYLRSLPNMTVMSPRNAAQLRGMLKAAACLDAPCAIRYPKAEAPDDNTSSDIIIGRGELLAQGGDLTICAVGDLVNQALAAAQLLALGGINADVIDARFVAPLDEDLIFASVDKTGRLLTVEENVAAGGFGSAVLQALAASGRNVQAELCALDPLYDQGERDDILRSRGLTAEGIADRARVRWFEVKE